MLDAGGDGCRYGWEGASDRANAAVELELAKRKNRPARVRECASLPEDGEGNWQIVGGSFLRQIRWREVDKHAIQGKLVPRIANRGPNSLSRLSDRSRSEPNEIHGRNASANVDLDMDEMTFIPHRFVCQYCHALPLGHTHTIRTDA